MKLQALLFLLVIGYISANARNSFKLGEKLRTKRNLAVNSDKYLELAKNFVGSWKRVKMVNHEEYLRAVGCDEATVKAALIADKAESTLEVKLDGKHFTWNQVNAGKKWNHSFTLDKEMENSSPHGSYKSIVYLDEDKMFLKAVPLKIGENIVTSDRWIEGARMFETRKAGDVTLNLEFVRV